MKLWTIAIALFVVLGASSLADAADWTTTEAGSVVCSAVKPPGICWLKDIAADSSVISVRACPSMTIMVYGTGADIMPQACDDTSCTKAEDLLATALTGDSPNTFLTSAGVPLELVRIDWTSGGAAPTVSIKCGR